MITTALNAINKVYCGMKTGVGDIGKSALNSTRGIISDGLAYSNRQVNQGYGYLIGEAAQKANAAKRFADVHNYNFNKAVNALENAGMSRKGIIRDKNIQDLYIKKADAAKLLESYKDEFGIRTTIDEHFGDLVKEHGAAIGVGIAATGVAATGMAGYAGYQAIKD